MKKEDLTDLSDGRLHTEFERIAVLRDECEDSLAEIRAEKARRKNAENEMIRSKLKEGRNK